MWRAKKRSQSTTLAINANTNQSGSRTGIVMLRMFTQRPTTSVSFVRRFSKTSCRFERILKVTWETSTRVDTVARCSRVLIHCGVMSILSTQRRDLSAKFANQSSRERRILNNMRKKFMEKKYLSAHFVMRFSRAFVVFKDI